MNFLFKDQFQYPYIKVKKNKKTEKLNKEHINSKMSFFPDLSCVIEEIGLIKIFEEKKILCNYSNYYHVKYLEEREKGINNIKNLSIKYNFTLDVVLKSIDYMDRFFLSEKLNNIIEISSICLLISLKFNESFSIKTKKFIKHLKKTIANLIKIEEEILLTLNYDLNTFTLMDIIHLFFINNNNFFEKIKDSPEFTRKIWFYAQAIIEDQRYLDFTILELAQCLILFSLSNHFINYKKEKLGNELHNYHKKLSQMDNIKLIQCKFILNIILSSRFKKM